jgi:cobalt-zinc-cadmium efflux system outer membrane protein
MLSVSYRVGAWISIGLSLLFSPGCRTNGATSWAISRSQLEPAGRVEGSPDASECTPGVQLTALEEPIPPPIPTVEEFGVSGGSAEQHVVASLAELEAYAIDANPRLRRLREEAAAKWAQVRYVDKLPDPSIGATAFAPPMNLDPDRQLANLEVMQTIPWIGRLRAEAQRSSFEALAAVNDYQAGRLRVIGDLRVAWYRLYVLNKQVETTEAEKLQLETLITSANARVRNGTAAPGDVLLATLELSSLQEQLISYRQEVVSTTAEINRLVGRRGQHPIAPPARISSERPDWDYELLQSTAFAQQPELNAARMRAAATRWGIEVARLQRRPDLTFGAEWIIMDAPGATAPDAGQDSAMIGVSATVPLWRDKYDAMVSEARRMHRAAHASEDEVIQELEAVIRGLWEEVQASHQTVQLYEHTIIPQARQTFEADQASLANNAVTFDRVIRDYRSLLNMQLGYHRALGQLASSIARLQQTIGTDLLVIRSDGPSVD